MTGTTTRYNPHNSADKGGCEKGVSAPSDVTSVSYPRQLTIFDALRAEDLRAYLARSSTGVSV